MIQLGVELLVPLGLTIQSVKVKHEARKGKGEPDVPRTDDS